MPFSDEQKQKFKEAFDVFDTDKSGQISQSELSKVMSQLGYNLNDAQVTQIMTHIDSDKSGEISFDEFLVFIAEATK